MRMDRIEDVFVHAPVTSGARFSGVDASEVSGGKSVD